MMDVSQLERLVQQLADAKREYVRLRFDEESDQVLGPPASATQIARLEEIIGRRLPPSYRAFLELHNGWTNFSGGAKLLAVEDHGSAWVEERIRYWTDIIDDGPSPFEGGAIPVLLGEEENQILVMDPSTTREDGEMDFVDYDYGHEHHRFDDFPAFLQYELLLTEKLIARERKGADDDDIAEE